MALITTSDIQNAANLKGVGGEYLAKHLMKQLKLDKINDLYEGLENTSTTQFLDGVFKSLNIQIEIPDDELSRVPKNGPFVVVANHPYGGLDGLVLLKMIQSVRPDFKIMANYLLMKVDPISESLLAVNPFERKRSSVSSFAGIKHTMDHLAKGGCLGIFPAGEVSNFQVRERAILDKEWDKGAIKLIRKARVPIIPVYFHEANSTVFQLLSLLHKNLQTAQLPAEIFKKKNKMIKVRIGKPISVDKQSEIEDINEFGRYLRAKTYYLGHSFNVNSFFRNKNFRTAHPSPIAPPTSQFQLIKEISRLPKEDLLFKFKEFEVYCSKSSQIPEILNELGRLREVSFRAVGEGTNNPRDLDEYDLYYRHLFVWDSKNENLVGAYRIGHGPDIYSQFGKRGFYIHSLFKIKAEFGEFLSQSIELGRSFVEPEYQKNPYALFILWKGILYYLTKHDELKYILGPVSISNQYSKVSKSLMINFIQENYFDEVKAALIAPRKRFRYKSSKGETQLKPKTMKELESLIEEMEPAHFKLPVLLKKYLKQNAQIIGFNVDPKFNNALDGLIYLDIDQVNLETIQMLAKEVEDPSILERFRTSAQ